MWCKHHFHVHSDFADTSCRKRQFYTFHKTPPPLRLFAMDWDHSWLLPTKQRRRAFRYRNWLQPDTSAHWSLLYFITGCIYACTVEHNQTSESALKMTWKTCKTEVHPYNGDAKLGSGRWRVHSRKTYDGWRKLRLHVDSKIFAACVLGGHRHEAE